jgi:striatin 1/3/4
MPVLEEANHFLSVLKVTLDKESFRKTWMAKYTLRSHFDCVRALAFHPIEPVLVTASEDHTLKMWNLQKTVSAKK